MEGTTSSSPSPNVVDLKASGARILAGIAGSVYHHHGQILITRAAVKGIDSNLLRVLEAAVDDLEISIEINSIDTGAGQHVPTSRHFHGCAVDIDRVGLVGHPLEEAHIANKEARELVQWLIDHGFVAGHENGPYPAVLFGPVGCKWNRTQIGHVSHLHVSLHPAAGE
jgi:hypothetical protein